MPAAWQRSACVCLSENSHRTRCARAPRRPARTTCKRVLGRFDLVMLGIGARHRRRHLRADRTRRRRQRRARRRAVDAGRRLRQRARRAVLRRARVERARRRLRLHLRLRDARRARSPGSSAGTSCSSTRSAPRRSSVGWSGHLTSLLRDLGIPFPAALSAAPGTLVAVPGGDPVTAIVNLPAILLVVAVTALLVVGIRESASINTIMVMIKVSVVIAHRRSAAVWFIMPSNWTPFVPPNTGTFGEFGWSGVIRGGAIIFFAYIGFDAVSTAAQEAKRSAARHAVRHSRLARRSARCCTCSRRASWWGSRRISVLRDSPAPMVAALDYAQSGRPAAAAASWLSMLERPRRDSARSPA